ncbi:hypothetical protein ACIRON_05270 [Nocardioides sp. NPDC101246]|uniref:hypothetical protein n=1 Tax=Nocardioides sp. NPDC101246 TaxID=3364336 RepID=UPI003806B08B
MSKTSRLWAIGLVANVLACAAVCSAYALSQPLYGTADESAHADHAYRLWHGELVRIGDPMRMPQLWGFHPPFDWTGQHPPLYYLFQAPVIGPLTDADHLLIAGLAGRAVTVGMTCGLVVAVMWAAYVIVPTRPRAAVMAGAVTAVTPGVASLGGMILNDTVFALWVTLMVGLSAQMLRRGIGTGTAVAFALCATAALATRLPGAVVIAVCASVLGVRWLLEDRRWTALARLSGAVAFAVLVNAWFYLRNLRATGNLSGAQSELVGQPGPLQNRTVRPVHEVAFDPEVWRQLLTPLALEDHRLIGLLLTIAPVLAGVVVILRRSRRWGAAEIWTGLLAVVLVVAIIGLQLTYVAQGGGASWRYLVPLTVVSALLSGIGLTAAPRLSWVVSGLWLVAILVLLIGYVSLPNDGAGEVMAPTFPAAVAVAVVLAGLALVGTLVSVAGFTEPASSWDGRDRHEAGADARA